jgi:hypothetical protein
MNSSRLSLARRAFSLVRAPLLLRQLCLAAIVFVLSLLWLKIPDATILNLVSTALLGAAILATAGVGEAWIMLTLAQRPTTRKSLAKGAVIVLVTSVLCIGWSMLPGHLQDGDQIRAGYLNSRLPHSLRTLFSYEHILIAFHWMEHVLEWLGIGAIVTFAFALLAAPQPLRSTRQTLRSLTFWVLFLAASLGFLLITASLTEWTPGHGLRVELLSVALRLTTAILIDTCIVCYVLALLTVAVQKSTYATPAGAPVASQPRTDDMP